MVKLEEIVFGQDATTFHPKSKCHHSIDIFWTKEVGSAIFQSPLITDVLSDGKKEIVVPTFVKYLEVLSGENGFQSSGFPYTHSDMTSQASTLLYDIDKDGQSEIVFFTKTGEIVFFSQNGQPLYDLTLKIPPLEVRKNWYSGMDDSKIDISMNLERKKKNIKTGRKILETKQEEKKSDTFEIGTSTGWLSEEAVQSMDLISFLPNSTFFDDVSENKKNPFKSSFFESYLKNTTMNKKKFAYIDGHILSTPIIIDLDNDGHDELIVPVSYYYDKEFYSDPVNMQKLDTDIDISKYVAGGIVVFDLETRKIKWKNHLDLTTDKTKQKAYIYGSPTVVDIDGDNSLEVIIGTSMGFIFVFDKNGDDKPGTQFPIHIGEIQGQIITEDINGDGELELCAVDFNSNLVCFNYRGEEIWERRLSGYIDKTPMIGDINGDGILDIVIGTSTGHIWAVRGTDGEVLQHFPVRTNGAISASPLLLNMNKIEKKKNPKKSLSVIIPSFDGYVYIVNGKSGCIDKIDIGEKSVSQILTDDITGSGKMDLLIATTNGKLFTLHTHIPYHPMKSWTAPINSINGFSYREYYHGIYVSLRSRKMKDIIGNSFVVEFVIIDERKYPNTAAPRTYDIRITLGKKKILLKKRYNKPGLYIEKIKTPTQRLHGTIQVEMTNEHGQVYLDRFSLSFNMTFLRTLKFMILGPFLLIFGYLMLLKPLKTKSSLPI
eukprot:gene10387-2916_t